MGPRDPKELKDWRLFIESSTSDKSKDPWKSVSTLKVLKAGVQRTFGFFLFQPLITMHLPFGSVHCSDEKIIGRVHWFLSFALPQNYIHSLTYKYRIAVMIKVIDQIKNIILHFTPWKFRFWYQKKSHIFLIAVVTFYRPQVCFI